jgi:hypothetical protein
VLTLVVSKLIPSAGRYAIPRRLALLAGIVTATAALAQAVPSPANQQPQTSPPSASPAPAASALPAKASKTAPAAKATKPAGPPSRYLPNRFAGRAGLYYRMVWGIDSPTLKWTESGEVIRFSWRVLDPQKASALNDKKVEPSLIDPRAGVSLVVPQMEKIGQLRQSAPPEAGKSYWMAFSNKGLLVKRGDRVVVVVGPFRADGLVVD